MADVQDDVQDELTWDLRALAAADLITYQLTGDAGDVTGHPKFVYVAAAHGTLATDNALDGAGRRLDYHHLPRVTFTTPAIASAGLTETQAIEQGHTCDCRVLPLANVPRASINRDTRGVIKLDADASTGRLLGAHVIATAVYALANQMTVHQMADL